MVVSPFQTIFSSYEISSIAAGFHLSIRVGVCVNRRYIILPILFHLYYSYTIVSIILLWQTNYHPKKAKKLVRRHSSSKRVF